MFLLKFFTTEIESCDILQFQVEVRDGVRAIRGKEVMQSCRSPAPSLWSPRPGENARVRKRELGRRR